MGDHRTRHPAWWRRAIGRQVAALGAPGAANNARTVLTDLRQRQAALADLEARMAPTPPLRRPAG